MIGPDLTTAILVAASVAPLVAGGDPARYATLVAMLTIMVGVIAIIAGIARMGFIADFVSKPILIGYMDGAALIIIESQLGKLFGMKTPGNNFLEKLWSIIIQLGQTQWLTLAIGLTLIALLIILRRISPRIPGAIIVVVLSTLASWLLHLDAHGVSVVGQISAGLPKPTIPNIQFGDIGNSCPSCLRPLAWRCLHMSLELPQRGLLRRKSAKSLTPTRNLSLWEWPTWPLVSVKDLSLLEVNQELASMTLRAVKRSWSVSSPLCC